LKLDSPFEDPGAADDGGEQPLAKRTYVQRSSDDKRAILDFASQWKTSNPGGSQKSLLQALSASLGTPSSTARRLLKTDSVQAKQRGRPSLMSDNTKAALRLWAERSQTATQAVPISQELYRVKV